jgi:hypothetical protein
VKSLRYDRRQVNTALSCHRDRLCPRSTPATSDMDRAGPFWPQAYERPDRSLEMTGWSAVNAGCGVDTLNADGFREGADWPSLSVFFRPGVECSAVTHLQAQRNSAATHSAEQGYRPITHSEWYYYLVLENLELITSSGVFVSGFQRQSELGYKLATCWGVYPRCPG